MTWRWLESARSGMGATLVWRSNAVLGYVREAPFAASGACKQAYCEGCLRDALQNQPAEFRLGVFALGFVGAASALPLDLRREVAGQACGRQVGRAGQTKE